MTPKLEFFNFGQIQKLDCHSCVEFHSDSDGDGFNFLKPQLNPPKCPLVAPKKIFQFWTRTKVRTRLIEHSCVGFHGDSDGNGFKAQKLVIDLLIVLKCIKSNQLLKRHPITARGLEFASQLWLLSLIYR